MEDLMAINNNFNIINNNNPISNKIQNLPQMQFLTPWSTRLTTTNIDSKIKGIRIIIKNKAINRTFRKGLTKRGTMRSRMFRVSVLSLDMEKGLIELVMRNLILQ